MQEKLQHKKCTLQQQGENFITISAQAHDIVKQNYITFLSLS
jgi:hypothetical protein